MLDLIYIYATAGISIIEDGSEGITMELEIKWDGNTSIILDIVTCVGVALPVQVISFTICCSYSPKV